MIRFEHLPKSIDGNAFMLALKEMGIDIEKQPLIRLEFKSKGLYLEIEATNEDDQIMLDSYEKGGTIATHTIFIPFTW